MNKCLLYLSLFLFLSVGFAACDEVEEVGEYDNWEPRNTAFIDSIHALAADRLLPLNAAQEEADKFEPANRAKCSVWRLRQAPLRASSMCIARRL